MIKGACRQKNSHPIQSNPIPSNPGLCMCVCLCMCLCLCLCLYMCMCSGLKPGLSMKFLVSCKKSESDVRARPSEPV